MLMNNQLLVLFLGCMFGTLLQLFLSTAPGNKLTPASANQVPRHANEKLKPAPLFQYPFDTESSPQWVVFYTLVLSRSNALDVMKRHIVQLQKSYAAERRLTLFYNVVFDNDHQHALTDVTKQVNNACQAAGLACRCLSQSTKNKKKPQKQQARVVDTLERIYEFCNTYGNFKVIYLHTTIQTNNNNYVYGGGFNRTSSTISNSTSTAWEHMAVDAVTSAFPLSAADEGCNAYGLQFDPFASAFAGHVWTAECKYVQRLLPPRTYALQVKDAATKLAPYVRRQQMVVNSAFEALYNTSMDEHHVLQQWIGSHPSLDPCDAFGDSLPTTVPLVKKKVDLTWRMAPRFDALKTATTLLYSNKPNEQWNAVFDKTNDATTREYFFLAGHLFRWFALYEESPPPSSWVWSFFPNGDRWKSWVERYGNHAVVTILKRNDTASE
jgi:hypothetical protein